MALQPNGFRPRKAPASPGLSGGGFINAKSELGLEMSLGSSLLRRSFSSAGPPKNRRAFERRRALQPEPAPKESAPVPQEYFFKPGLPPFVAAAAAAGIIAVIAYQNTEIYKMKKKLHEKTD